MTAGPHKVNWNLAVRHWEILLVPCPDCRRPGGKPCFWLSKRQYPRCHHPARIRAAQALKLKVLA